jgi:hypothetical protein
MLGFDVGRKIAAAAIGLGLSVGFLMVVGCSEPTTADKGNDPALKASMKESMQIYKSKTPPRKGSSVPSKIQQPSPVPSKIQRPSSVPAKT